MGSYRIDVVRGGELIEIQCASLSAIRSKTIDLLQRHDVRIVKPSIDRTRICKRLQAGGPVQSRRRSPRRGQPHELFEELIYLRDIFPHPRLTVEIPIIDVNQYRWVRTGKTRRRRDPGYVIEDTDLEAVHRSIELHQPSDLWRLLTADPTTAEPPPSLLGTDFNTADIATAIQCPRWIAQRIAYVLRHSNAITPTARTKTGIQYRPAA